MTRTKVDAQKEKNMRKMEKIFFMAVIVAIWAAEYINKSKTGKNGVKFLIVSFDSHKLYC